MAGVLFAGHSSIANAASWVQATSPTAVDLLGVSCASSKVCVIVGKSGTVLYTADGKTWTAAVSGTTVALSDVFAYSSSKIFAVGSGGTILRSVDSGVTWSAMTSGTTEALTGVFFISSNVGWVVGASGSILKTIDGGTTWTAVSALVGVALHDISATSTSVVWTAGMNGGVFRSADGGVTWASVPAYESANDIFSIRAATSSIAYAAGENATFTKTSDSGATWTESVLTGFGASEHVTGSAWYTSLSGSVVGSAGSILSTTDGGVTFTADSKSFSPADIAFIASPSVSYRYFVGKAGVIGTYDSFVPSTVSSIGLTSGLSYTNDTTPSLTWTAATDNESSIASYQLSVDSGPYTTFGNVLTASVPSDLGAGAHTMGIRAVDAAGNAGTPTPGSFTIDLTAPAIDVISPTSATAGSSMTFSATITDASSGISGCSLVVNGLSVSAMTYSSTLLKYAGSFSFTSAGSYSVQASCTDVAGNSASGSAVTVTVSAASSTDTVAPTVGTVSPSTVATNVSTTFSASVTDAVGVTSCSLYDGTSYVAAMTVSGGVATYTYTYTSSGTYNYAVHCVDAAGNAGTGASQTVTVAADSTVPTVGQISQSTAVQNISETMSATVTDNVAVTSCSLYVNSSNVGSMSISGSTASKAYPFASAGSYTVYAVCADATGNSATGSSRTVTVSAASSTPAVEAAKGDLIKMDCGDSVDVTDPCRAVYYYGDDGSRHAFPNENVYFTWYTNFDDVVIVTDSFMASLTLGHNVTYHPGTRMVKFITLNTVYAVGTSGELRGIASEELAISLYGSTWNTQIDDISDAFHGNYTFGENIDSTSDYSPASVQAGSTSIEDVL